MAPLAIMFFSLAFSVRPGRMPRMNSVSSPPMTNVTRPGEADRRRSAARAARTVSAIVSSGPRSQTVGENQTSRPASRAASVAISSRPMSRATTRTAVQWRSWRMISISRRAVCASRFGRQGMSFTTPAS
jgi:hypothetical protein